MAAITVKREGTGDTVSFDTVAEVGSAAEFISFIEKVWGEGVLLKPVPAPSQPEHQNHVRMESTLSSQNQVQLSTKLCTTLT